MAQAPAAVSEGTGTSADGACHQLLGPVLERPVHGMEGRQGAAVQGAERKGTSTPRNSSFCRSVVPPPSRGSSRKVWSASRRPGTLSDQVLAHGASSGLRSKGRQVRWRRAGRPHAQQDVAESGRFLQVRGVRRCLEPHQLRARRCERVGEPLRCVTRRDLVAAALDQDEGNVEARNGCERGPSASSGSSAACEAVMPRRARSTSATE